MIGQWSVSAAAHWRDGQFARSRAIARRVEFEQFGDLGERKSRCLCRFDEAQTAQNRLVVTPDSAFRRGAGRLRRNGQQAAALVIADRLDIDAALPGKLADGHVTQGLDSVLWYGAYIAGSDRESRKANR